VGAFKWQLRSINSLTLGAINRVLFGVEGLGSFTYQGALGPYMAELPKEGCQANFSLPANAIGRQIRLLIVEVIPQPLHEDVVATALPS
jgi:hypothetical protein